MKSIGGYLGWETGRGSNHLTSQAYLLNSGRAACLLFLKHRRIQELWVPYYICGDFIDTLTQNNVSVEFYHIDQAFEIDTPIPGSAHVLYVNYFGVKDAYIRSINEHYTTLVIDNSMALFNTPVDALPTFYSPRKFVGIPDGGLLYSNDLIDTSTLPESHSHEHVHHLLIQVDQSTEAGYADFRKNERRIIESAPARMSRLTRKLIDSLDVDRIIRIRRDNFSYLHERCAGINRLDLEYGSLFMYPLFVRDGSELRSYLIENKVFTPTLWADQLHLVTANLEHDLIENIVHLPIDQRYTEEDMERIANLIQAYYA